MANNENGLKIEVWKKAFPDGGKMLDFQKEKDSSLRILSPDFQTLFQRLVVRKEELHFETGSQYGNAGQTGNFTGSVSGGIDTECSEEECEHILEQLFSISESSLSNHREHILYLFFGFVKWKREDKEGMAPLFLVPVDLRMEAGRKLYRIKKGQGNIMVNPILAEVLAADFEMELPEFDAEQTTPGMYVQKLQALLAPQGWSIRREVDFCVLESVRNEGTDAAKEELHEKRKNSSDPRKVLQYMKAHYGIGQNWTWKQYCDFLRTMRSIKIQKLLEAEEKSYFEKLFAQIPGVEAGEVLEGLERWESCLRENGYSAQECKSEAFLIREREKFFKQYEGSEKEYRFLEEYEKLFSVKTNHREEDLKRHKEYMEAVLAYKETEALWLEEKGYREAQDGLKNQKAAQKKLERADQELWKYFEMPASEWKWSHFSRLQSFYSRKEQYPEIMRLIGLWISTYNKMIDTGLSFRNEQEAEESRSSLEKERAELGEMQEFLQSAAGVLAISYQTVEEGLERTKEAVRILQSPYHYRISWILDGQYSAICEMEKDLEELAQKLSQMAEKLGENWTEEFLELDISGICYRFQYDYQSFVKRMGGQYKQDRQILSQFQKNSGIKMSDEMYLAGMQELQEYQRERELFDRKAVIGRTVFPEYFDGLETDWGQLRDFLECCGWIENYKNTYGILGQFQNLIENRREVRNGVKIGNAEIGKDVSAVLQQYQNKIASYGSQNLSEVNYRIRQQMEGIKNVENVWDTLNVFVQKLWPDAQKKCRIRRDVEFTIGLFKKLNEILDAESSYERLMGRIRGNYPAHFSENEMDWEQLREDLENSRGLIEYAKKYGMTGQQIDFALLPLEERRNRKIAGLSLSEWLQTQKHLKTSSGTDGNSEKDYFELQKVCEALEKMVQILGLMKQYFSSLEEGDLQEKAKILKDYLQVEKVIGQQHTQIGRQLVQMGLHGDCEDLFGLLEEEMRDLPAEAQREFSGFEGDRRSYCLILTQGNKYGSRTSEAEKAVEEFIKSHSLDLDSLVF